MQPSLHRQRQSKHVQFALEPQVQIIDTHCPIRHNSSVVTANNEQIIISTSEITTKDIALNTQSICENPQNKLNKTPSRNLQQKPLTRPKCFVVLLAETNTERRSFKCDNLFVKLSMLPSECDAIYTLPTNQSERIRSSRNSTNLGCGIGCDRTLEESCARWLCHRQVSNAMQFWTSLMNIQCCQRQQRLIQPALTTTLHRSSRSPRLPSVPTCLPVCTRYFKRSDGLRLVCTTAPLLL